MDQRGLCQGEILSRSLVETVRDWKYGTLAKNGYAGNVEVEGGVPAEA